MLDCVGTDGSRHVVQLLQLVVEPHLDGEPLADQRHLVAAVLRRQELLAALFHLQHTAIQTITRPVTE